MLETWRWFGPLDDISLAEIVQTGARGIVTALHEIPYGEVWSRDAIAARKGLVEAQPGLHWSVVESLPVHEDIKLGTGALEPLFAAYRQSLANLAAEGITTVCYNFMPLLDWTRTDLEVVQPTGATALRFDIVRMAAFDCFMLERAGAEDDYAADVRAQAAAWIETATPEDRETLLSSIMAGLPGAYARFDVAGLREALIPWAGFTADDLRATLARFLAEVVPTAEELGVNLCIHPDDPPRPILGLPRIVSGEDDIAYLLGLQDSRANGLTLCTGSLGAGPDNDPVRIAQRFSDRIHFAHLRNVSKDADGSFQEAEHLAGDTDMPAVLAALLAEETRRQAEGRVDAVIPFRPDHGHAMLQDIGRKTHPGYPLIGRMRGLAELRGVIAGLQSRASNP